MKTIVQGFVCAAIASAPVYAQTSDTLDVATWNIEWFGDDGRGPDNIPQFLSARDAILDGQIELWAVQEIEDSIAFALLLNELSGYDGFLARDVDHVDDASEYTWERQEVGIIYRSSTVTIRNARIILPELAKRGPTLPPFATGRPPMEVVISVPGHDTIVVIVLHAKAQGDPESARRRREAAVALHEYVDSTWPSTPVLLLGDLNDEISRTSPYSVFANDSRGWLPLTARLAGSHVSGAMWDHILVSNEAACWYVRQSAGVLHPPAGRSVSDHRPVTARFVVRQSCNSP